VWEALVAIAGFLSAVAGIAKWLLVSWEKAQKETEELRSSLRNSEIRRLEDALEKFEVQLRATETKLTTLEATMRIQATEYKEARLGYAAIGNSLNTWIDKTNEAQKKLETALVAISKEVIMLKGKVRA